MGRVPSIGPIWFGGVNETLRKKMSQTYTAVIKQDADWWIGWIEEVPGVNCQESSWETLLQSLRETLIEAIELNRADEHGCLTDAFADNPV